MEKLRFFSKKHNDRNSKSDLVAKILSIAAAILLWFYVIDAQTTMYEKQFNAVPVSLENFLADSGLDIISGRESTIDVKLRGTKAQINAIDISDIKASADMSQIYETGDFSLEVNVSVPSGVTILEKSVNSVIISVDRTIGRSVPVDKDLSYMLPDSYELGEITCSPMSVYISGPQDVVDNIEKGIVKLDLGTVTNKVTAKSEIILVDKNGNEVINPYIRRSDTSAEINVPVVRTMKKKVELVDISDGIEYDFVVSPSNVMLKGNASTVEAISVVKTEPFEVQGAGVLNVRLSLPSDVAAFDANGNVISSVGVTVKNVRFVQEKEKKMDKNGENK